MGEKSKPLKVALVGAGTVGSEVARLLLTQREEFARRAGREIELAGVAVRNVSKERPGIPSELLTDDTMGLVSRKDIDIVVELMGGVDETKGLIMKAIETGKSVVTGNKALLSAFGEEIFSASNKAGVDVYFEAAVAGAIPIIRPLRDSLVGDKITKVAGIVNGTTNYILDKMTTEGMEYETALKQAQELGYAEQDPTADVGGADAAAKAAILASLAFRTPVNISDVYCEGITKITQTEISAAHAANCVVKLLAMAELIDGEVHVRVHPVMLPKSHPLASIAGAYNAIMVEAEAADKLMFMGPGAGGAPTASAVVGDLVTVARNRVAGISLPVLAGFKKLPIAKMGSTRCHYQLTLDLTDEAGVLASVATTLAKHNVSVYSLEQVAVDESGDHASVGLMTHEALEADVLACMKELRDSDYVSNNISFIRVGS
ncbi:MULTISPECIES: homoserine dehydrogenase [Propionimicrobium]|uniref:homoserine dehydrogenase n=1 Tax=Propionimicrobium TaxID=203133 RepID=UPI0003D797CB|nr:MULTISPECIES: homoserine dehydrogenase [Propionimicrobium]ETJ97835.1 homoserine dehydrogenase [Propionimicrobium sp. BV2F7]